MTAQEVFSFMIWTIYRLRLHIHILKLPHKVVEILKVDTFRITLNFSLNTFNVLIVLLSMAYRYYHGESFLRPKKRNWTEGSGREKCVRKTLFLIRLQTRNNSVLLIHEPSSIPSGKVRRTSEQTSLSVCEDKRGFKKIPSVGQLASAREKARALFTFSPGSLMLTPAFTGFLQTFQLQCEGFFSVEVSEMRILKANRSTEKSETEREEAACSGFLLWSCTQTDTSCSAWKTEGLKPDKIIIWRKCQKLCFHFYHFWLER